MASVFIKATNTGEGFITHEDRLAFTLNGVGDDVYEVSGDYQAWVTRVGGIELDYTTQLLTMEKNKMEILVQKYLDDTAAVKGYDNIVSACSYATDTSIFGDEGRACVEFRRNVWLTCYTIMNEVLANTRPTPTEQELLAALPTMVWPI